MPIMPIVNLPAEHPFFTAGGSSREQKMEEFFEKGLPPKMAALVNILGCNSIDIVNFGPKIFCKTGPSFVPHSVLATPSLDMSQNPKHDLGQVLCLILGQQKCLLNCIPGAQSRR